MRSPVDDFAPFHDLGTSMAHYISSVATPLSAAAAFAYMSDVTRFAEWDPGIQRAVRVAGSGPGVGAIYDLTVTAGATTTMRYEVKEYEAPHRMLMTSRTTLLTSVDEIRVAPAGAGSIITYDAVLTLNGPLRLFDPLLRRAFQRIGDRAIAGLRRELAGTAVAS
jgi:carbon monoxide dehydrogenase subunit G